MKEKEESKLAILSTKFGMVIAVLGLLISVIFMCGYEWTNAIGTFLGALLISFVFTIIIPFVIYKRENKS